MSKRLFILVIVFLMMVIPGRFIPGALLPGDVVYETYDTPEQPEIVLNRTDLYFAAATRGAVSDAQAFAVSNGGGGTLKWEITDNVNWLAYSAESGQGAGSITVTADPTGLAAGSYAAVIAVSDLNASNTPQIVNVYLEVYPSGTTTKPFGKFATPKDGSIVSGSVPVTGWALDDIGVDSVKLYSQEGTALVYIGDALFVEGARPDVEQAFPTYPSAYKAGWGYMLLTYFLPDEENVEIRTFTLHAIAVDKEGTQVTLGVTTITRDNVNAVKPFGAIDKPGQGGTASGSLYRNEGWVLTPPPNKIPEDGSTIDVYVDGVNLGNPVYNLPRPDIALLFPGYANRDGAGAYLDFDTTAYTNGVHTIQWTARDNAGNAEGIGSRYFTIQNGQSAERRAHGAERRAQSVACLEPVGIIKGYARDVAPREMYPDHKGIINIQIKELERLELRFVQRPAGGLAPLSHTPRSSAPLPILIGYHVVDYQWKPLPIGSFLDKGKGIFYWQPGVGFYGTYEFVFIKMAGNRREETRLRVTILPKY
jgi:hypothetical protein